MKLLQILQIAVKSVRKKLLINFLLTALLTFLLFMSFLTVATLTGPYVGKLSAQLQTGKKFSQIGVLLVDGNVEWDKRLDDFLKGLYTAGLVEGIGGYGEAGMQDAGLKPLLQLQNASGVKPESYNDITLMGYFTDDLSLFERDCELDRELIAKNNAGEDILLVVGDLFREIPLGTVIQSDIVPDRQYIVVGYMPHDYHYFVEFPYNDDSVLNASMENPMDERVIFLIQSDSFIETSAQILYREDGITDEVLSRIQERADEEGIRISLMKLETAFTRNSRRAKKESGEAFPYLASMLLSVCVMLLSNQLFQIIGNDGKKYGIYYAVGFCDRDIHLEMVFENCFRLTAALAIAAAGFVKALDSVYSVTLINGDSRRLLFAVSFGAACLMAVMIGIILTEIPFKMMKKKNPAELMRGRE